MGVPKTSDHIQINIRMPNPSQEPPVSSKAPNEDLKDMDVPCIFKMKKESQNSDHGYIKDLLPTKSILKTKFGTWVYQRPLTSILDHGRILSF